MATVELVRYDRANEDEWNRLVGESRNGTFLLDRGYMDYHADRFADHSFLAVKDGRLVALLPAHQKEDMLISHGGLTYGGFITSDAMTLGMMNECFSVLSDHMREGGFRQLLYKSVPAIYHRIPSQEDLHALFLGGASLFRRDVLLVIDQENRGPVQERRKRAIKKALRSNLSIRDTADYAGYWKVLTENLRAKHGCDPVHSLSEIELLAARFPGNIQLTACYNGEEILAGVVAFISSRVVHLQYIASTDDGRATGALDLLLDSLVQKWQQKRFFDFGAATEQDGRYVNAGLLEFKEGFGARTVAHDFYLLGV